MSNPKYTQTWFLQGKVLGQWPIGLQHTHESLHAPQSYAYCCPVCGDVWARRIISPETRWMFWAVNCPKHPDHSVWRRPPGSLLTLWMAYDISMQLPLPLLQREALLAITAALEEVGE